MTRPDPFSVDAALLQDITSLRRDLHQHPELAYQEHRTAAIVADTLRALGCEVATGIAETGVVGVMDFGPRPILGVRADMDALPMQEKTGRAYASKIPGQMHVCGHDGHTAILIMAAKMLAQHATLKGKLVLIFQPAEENEGGAKAMVEAGLFDRFPVDAIYGLHNMPGMPLGEVGATAGPVSAAFDTFEILLKGIGGHGAMPHLTIDPTIAASALISALNTIVSRNLDPMQAGVVTSGGIECDVAYNVIPDHVRVSGSCRSFTEATRELLETRIKAISRGIGLAYGTKNRCRFTRRYPPVINHAAETRQLIEALTVNQYPHAVHDALAPVMGSEDFAYFLEQRPGCYILLGAGDTGGALHAPNYDFNDAALAPGARIWVALAEHLLKPRAADA